MHYENTGNQRFCSIERLSLKELFLALFTFFTIFTGVLLWYQYHHKVNHGVQTFTLIGLNKSPPAQGLNINYNSPMEEVWLARFKAVNGQAFDLPVREGDQFVSSMKSGNQYSGTLWLCGFHSTPCGLTGLTRTSQTP